MEWFGLSLYGISNPIKHMMRPDYIEPTKPENLLELHKNNPTRSFGSLIKEIDVYIGQADGYSYKSYERLIKMRKKGIFKPVGPVDMYRYPGCTSMKIGWHSLDPALNNETWHKTVNIYK